MAFHVVYVAGGELDKVKKVNYVDRIRNFAYLSQPFNEMVQMNIPGLEGLYRLDYESPDEEVELLSFVVTCSGYGEDDYYFLYVNNELWFNRWFPTEVKEGLYIGTSTYVYKLAPKSKITLFFVNMSKTSKKVWLGVRMLREKQDSPVVEQPIIDTKQVSEPIAGLDIETLPLP
jgi:hypothetical protein